MDENKKGSTQVMDSAGSYGEEEMGVVLRKGMRVEWVREQTWFSQSKRNGPGQDM